MTDFEAVMIAEAAQHVDNEDEYIAAWQHLIDTGICWRLQGWFGRTASAMIEGGYCSSPRRHLHSLSPASPTEKVKES